jgi:hypothetical protein
MKLILTNKRGPHPPSHTELVEVGERREASGVCYMGGEPC